MTRTDGVVIVAGEDEEMGTVEDRPVGLVYINEEVTELDTAVDNRIPEQTWDEKQGIAFVLWKCWQHLPQKDGGDLD